MHLNSLLTQIAYAHSYLLGQGKCTQENIHTGHLLLEHLFPKCFASQNTGVQEGRHYLTFTEGFQLNS